MNGMLLIRFSLLSTAYSCYRDENKSMFHTVGVGATCRGFALSATKRINEGVTLRAAYERLILKDLYLRINT